MIPAMTIRRLGICLVLVILAGHRLVNLVYGAEPSKRGEVMLAADSFDALVPKYIAKFHEHHGNAYAVYDNFECEVTGIPSAKTPFVAVLSFRAVYADLKSDLVKGNAHEMHTAYLTWNGTSWTLQRAWVQLVLLGHYSRELDETKADWAAFEDAKQEIRKDRLRGG
jgi:hypothetical protein